MMVIFIIITIIKNFYNLLSLLFFARVLTLELTEL